MYKTTYESPVGCLRLFATDEELRAIAWSKEDEARVAVEQALEHASHPILRRTTEQLDEYFRGERTTFDLPLDPIGTPFQRRAWEALCQIPYGETRSYGEQARALGKPTAVRAVGAANGRNPISIVVPCHRVIGANGTLTGFAGGLSAKRFLLDHEASHRPS